MQGLTYILLQRIAFNNFLSFINFLIMNLAFLMYVKENWKIYKIN